ncbi:hypothetical protein DNH61_14300 [Paenibacillus sambharensis]|uniref:Type II secretion system protein GspF domain-containing protein n=1 Tax=Paenibacillus sambharensis TaxID=1803190 RepID=A0A2W1LML7_9BACL|nr:hypothetical protein [Paenibacillus sambharensis]PZD95684.1 hypothetical protein DNH61_14300 [Paenibacillus sambharensis]
MGDQVYRLVVMLMVAGQFVVGVTMFIHLLRAIMHRRPRWSGFAGDEGPERLTVPEGLLRVLGISRSGAYYLEREAILAGCGLTFDPGLYAAIRRLLIIGSMGCGVALALYPNFIPSGGLPVYGPAALSFAAAAVALWDLPMLEAFRSYRSERIMREIHAISNQLLYFAGSSLHIHAKLTRCLPYTSAIRGDLERMLGEWYHDADSALRRFKQRLGTAEGAGFAETIEAMRMHEDEAYYELLKERIADYKAKLELKKESRKESASYVLFILAGVPILYTFQIFIYPWVQEGQKLFQSLNS